MTDGNGNAVFSMPVAPAYGMGGGGGFGNGFGDSGWWIILLLLVCGWGNGNGFGGGGGMGGGNGLYPWMNQANQTNEGFRDQMLNDNVTSIRDGVFGISTQLCNGFSGVNQGVANGFAQAEIAANARQMADMQQNFALQSALANCCCENRTTALNNTRDIIDSQTRGTQAILDKLCALELDGVKGQLAQAQRENVGLQNQLNMANLAASQIAQNTQIVDSIYNRLSTCPVGTVPVFGEQPIFRCNNNNGCGCGCGGNGNF